MTYYAWTNFDVERNEWGVPTNTIKVGDEVSQDKLKASDEEWAELVANGAVREEEYPDIPPDVSPAEYLRQQTASGEATEDEVKVYADILTKSGTADTDAKAAILAGEAAANADESEETPKSAQAEAAKAPTAPAQQTASSSASTPSS